MQKTYQSLKLLMISLAAGAVWGGGCVTDNFWVDKWSEIVNRLIFGVINAGLAATPIGAI
jgi:hypothetical protein